MTHLPCSTETLIHKIRQCTACADSASPLPVKPRPVIQASRESKIRIIGQAPGTRVYESGEPFTDASGDRLRDWLGVASDEFYNPSFFAITPMGFCFPGQDSKGSDLPPRKECGPLWQNSLDAALPNIELTLVIGIYAMKWHLGDKTKKNLTETVKSWREYSPDIIPLPHPSWRNNGWIKRHDWFPDVLASLRSRVGTIIHR